MMEATANNLPFLASLMSVVYTLSYVGILYASALTRPRSDLSRDSPSVIRSRVRAVTAVTLVSLLSSTTFVTIVTGQGWCHVVVLLGLWPVTKSTIADALGSLLLTATLFAGPLLERVVLSSSGWDELKEDIHSIFYTWVGWRNLVAAPITEELVFRSCVVPLHILAGRSRSAIVFASPLYFGIAHIHHAYEFYLSHPNATIAAIRSIVQFAYTTVFGWFATFLFVRTGSVWIPILVHSLCNWIGVPRLRIEGPFWLTLVYYLSLVGGSWGFYKTLWSLTESPNALLQF